MKELDQATVDGLVERFLRYVRIDTTSDRHIAEIPSTPSQWDLLKLLVKELQDLGVSDLEMLKNGYIIARLPSNRQGGAPPTVGLMAHVDTASDAPGNGVNPKVHENYDGSVIEIGEGLKLDPEEFPELARYKGQTIITTDGRTLLGADDKAGVAEIMTALVYMTAHPELKHGPVEIIFTPDEETGKGLDLFPVDKLKSRCCYTLDGGELATVETECFTAYQVRARLTGRAIHLGSARGKLVNAVTMAGAFLSALPQSESPEATDERFGYYAPLEIKGNLEEATIDLFLRDFEEQTIQRRLAVLRQIAATIEAIYPPGKVELTETRQYSNMYNFIRKDPLVAELLLEAVTRSGLKPEARVIRGGTDGSRLSEMGIPTPNIFTGGHNYHSRLEWAAVPAMVKATETVLNLLELWGEQSA
ncbi:MAG TPA: peptidase T [Spirochaetia bacterium]|nr:peptidase T [Spirochaetia bacterium]